MDRYLWLLRHAKTVPDPPAGGTDHDRPLAPRGRRDAEALGRRLADGGDRLGLPPDCVPRLVLCSTATRTVQTTQRVLAGVADPPLVELRGALYGASPEQVLGELRTLDNAVSSVMVVGHNPTAHALAAGLAAPGDGAGRLMSERGFPTCALAVYLLDVGGWSDVDEGTGEVLGVFAPPY